MLQDLQGPAVVRCIVGGWLGANKAWHALLKASDAFTWANEQILGLNVTFHPGRCLSAWNEWNLPQELPRTKEKIEDQIEMCFYFFGVTEIYIVWYFGEEWGSPAVVMVWQL